MLYRDHRDYRRHISNIINVKPEVNCGRPTKFKHIRPKNFKEEFFRKREHALENNILVAKILNAKVITQTTNPFEVKLPSALTHLE